MKEGVKFLIIGITIIFILTSGCTNQSDNINPPTINPPTINPPNNNPDIGGPPLNPYYLPTLSPTPEDTPTITPTPTNP